MPDHHNNFVKQEFHQPIPGRPGMTSINPNVDKSVFIPQSLMARVYNEFEDEINELVDKLIDANYGKKDDAAIFAAIPSFEHRGTDEDKWGRAVSPANKDGTKDYGLYQINEAWVNRNGKNFSTTKVKNRKTGKVIDTFPDQVYVEVQKAALKVHPNWSDLTDKQRQEALLDKDLNRTIAKIIYDERGIDQWSVAGMMEKDMALNFANITLDKEKHKKDIKERILKGPEEGGYEYSFNPVSYKRTYDERIRKRELKKPENRRSVHAYDEEDVEAGSKALVRHGGETSPDIDEMKIDPKHHFDQTYIDASGEFVREGQHYASSPYYDQDGDNIMDEDYYYLNLANTLIHEMGHTRSGNPADYINSPIGEIRHLGHNDAGLSQAKWADTMYSIIGGTDYHLDEDQKSVLRDFSDYYHGIRGVDDKGYPIPDPGPNFLDNLFSIFGGLFKKGE